MREFRKKRCAGWRALLCAVCVVFALFGVVAEVYAADAAYISGTSTAAERGESVTVYFYLSGNPGVWGVKGEISYDTSVFTLKAVEAGSVFSAGEIIMNPDLSQTPFAFLATGSTIEDKKNEGTLVKATFSVKSDAKYGDYTIGFRILQFINANGEDVPCGASGAKITVSKCLHRKTELKNVVQSTEEAEGYSGDAYCTVCKILVKKGTTTPKYVNTCKHEKQTRTVVTEPTCEEAGLAKTVCPDCNKELSQEEIPAVGHVESALINAKSATTTEEGYTGDVHCGVCNKLLKEGEAIPKIKIFVFNMSMQTEDTYQRGSQAGLVFVSDAELATFVRVEINGSVLDEKNYTLESGSTKVTLKPEYLETLPDGKHTVTIVSDAGTASAQFYVAAEEEEPAGLSYRALLIIAIVAAVIAVTCVVIIVIIVAANKKNRRYDGDEEE